MAGPPLRELLEPGLLKWAAATVAQAGQAAEAALRTRQTVGDYSSGHGLQQSTKPTHSQTAAPGLESGMLDMSAFGHPSHEATSDTQHRAAPGLESGMLEMSAFGLSSYEPSTEEEPPPQQRPPAADFESGQLDMSAFGLPSPEPPAKKEARQQMAASGFESGMIDMSAFGLGPAPPQPAQSHSFESGHLDLSSFGLPAPDPAPRDTPQQMGSAAGGFDSGTLDMSAFGLDSPPQVAPPPHQTASDSFASGQIDMSAFGWPAPEPTPYAAHRTASSGFDSGQIDMSAFGLPAPEPPPQAAQRSAFESGELDMSAFGMPASHSSRVEAAGRGPTAAVSGNSSRNQPTPYPSLLSTPAEPPYRAEELAQLREQLGLKRDQPLLQPQGSRDRPGGASGMHTAASLFTSPSAGEERSAEEAADADGALALAAPGLTVEETAATLLLAELLLPDAGSQRRVPSRMPFHALLTGCDSLLLGN